MAVMSGMSRTKRFVLARIFPWVVVLAGAAAMYVGTETVFQARASLAWPAAEGTITNSNVELERTNTSGRDRTQPSLTYRARIAYEYAVDGTTYTGNRVSYGAYDTAEVSDAERVVRQYPRGRAVRIHYMPGNPAESVLEPGTAGLPWFYLALGMVFFTIGIALAVFLPKLAASAR